MQSSGYILTGLRKYRNRSHAPHILDYSLINDWFGMNEKALAFSDYESFDVRRVTKAVLYRLAENKLSDRPRQLSIDDFSVWVRPHHQGGIIICTQSDFLFAKAIKAITGRSATLATMLRSKITYPVKQLFVTMRGPVL